MDVDKYGWLFLYLVKVILKLVKRNKEEVREMVQWLKVIFVWV